MTRVGKFYGVGVGPGDPELLTLKAVRILGGVDVVCTPKSRGDKGSIALSIARRVLKRGCKVIEPLFPMVKNPEVLERHWDEAVGMIYGELREGMDVAFITLGDPLFYSTYAPLLRRMRERYPEVEIETVPGITSFLACMAHLNTPLVEGDEKLTVLPATYSPKEMEKILGTHESAVLMKVPKEIDGLIGELEALGLADKALFMSRCGSREFFSSPLEAMRGEKIDYLSMVVVKRRGFQ